MLREISLHNFKCFAKQTIKLSALNLLTGLNGMGKSSLIQSLLLLRQNYDTGLLQNDKELCLNGEVVNLGNARDILFQYFDTKAISIGLDDDEFGKSTWCWSADSEGDFLKPLSQRIEKNIYQAAIFGNNCQYLSAERIGPRVYSELVTQKVLNKNQLGFKGENIASYYSLFQSKPIANANLSHPSLDGFTLKEQLNAWLSEFRPGTRIDVTQNIDMGLVGFTYQFAGGKDVSNKFRPTNVGFGFSYLLPVLIAVLTAKRGSLLLIENPEAHLHPKGQVLIAELLCKAAQGGVQIIVESHSDHFLNGVRVSAKKTSIDPKNIMIQFYSGEIEDGRLSHKIQYPTIDSNGKLSNWPTGFFDEYEAQLGFLI